MVFLESLAREKTKKHKIQKWTDFQIRQLTYCYFEDCLVFPILHGIFFSVKQGKEKIVWKLGYTTKMWAFMWTFMFILS